MRVKGGVNGCTRERGIRDNTRKRDLIGRAVNVSVRGIVEERTTRRYYP